MGARLPFLVILAVLAAAHLAEAQPKCPSVLAMVRRRGPIYAEFHNLLKAIGPQRLPALNKPGDIHALHNAAVVKLLNDLKLPTNQTATPGKLWPRPVLRVLGARIAKRLIRPIPPQEKRCGQVTHVWWLVAKDLRNARRSPVPKPMMKAAVKASSTVSPIYNSPCDASKNTGAITDCNAGAVGTGYMLPWSGPTADTSGPSGVDLGLTFQSIFSNLAYASPASDSGQKCTAEVESYSSASSYQRSVSSGIGASATYNGVTGSANTQFNKTASNQASNQMAATFYGCTTSVQSFTLADFSIGNNQYLDTTFLSNAGYVMDQLIANNYDSSSPNVQPYLAALLTQYGTHYVYKSLSGTNVNQVCQMSYYTYAYANSKGWSFSANLNAGVGGLNAGGSSSSQMSGDFATTDSSCTSVQLPGPGTVPMSTNATGIDIGTWTNIAASSNNLVPILYMIAPITTLFNYPSLFVMRYSQAQLASISTAVQNYITGCTLGGAPGCFAPSTACASGTYASNGQCMSCFTTGPKCFMGDVYAPGAATSCSATKCNCNSPFTGSNCGTINYGVCNAERQGAKGCHIYCNQCAPGFDPDWSENADYCSCQCVPSGSSYNGVSSRGCGTKMGYYCGSNCGDVSCTNPSCEAWPGSS